MYKVIIISIIPELVLLCMIVSLVIPGSVSQSSLAQKQPTAANTTTSATSTNLQTYSNPSFGIKMQYPSNWLKLDLSRNNSSVLVVAFKTTAGRPLGVLFLSGNVNYGNVTLATLVSTRENQLRHTGTILHLVSSTPSTLAGNPAHKIVYTTIAPQGKFEAMQLISLVGKKGYFITYVVPTANYTTYLPTIQTMISSIEINK
ncbi:MAG: PsbP-related protein [Candidatus Nitrosopolaris sp.]